MKKPVTNSTKRLLFFLKEVGLLERGNFKKVDKIHGQKNVTSMVHTGKRNFPIGCVDKLIRHFNLDANWVFAMVDEMECKVEGRKYRLKYTE